MCRIYLLGDSRSCQVDNINHYSGPGYLSDEEKQEGGGEGYRLKHPYNDGKRSSQLCVCVCVCPLMLLSPGWALMDHFLPVALLALLVFKEECN